ncbi:hypothetical protein AB4Z52_30335 [Rhizobium sp. 2YAF20]
MSTGISSSDFVGQWSLSFADIDFINSKPAVTKLGLAAQLKFFSARGFSSKPMNCPAMISAGELPVGIAPRFYNISDFAA